jgi:hypothetical protein
MFFIQNWWFGEKAKEKPFIKKSQTWFIIVVEKTFFQLVCENVERINDMSKIIM